VLCVLSEIRGKAARALANQEKIVTYLASDRHYLLPRATAALSTRFG